MRTSIGDLPFDCSDATLPLVDGPGCGSIGAGPTPFLRNISGV